MNYMSKKMRPPAAANYLGVSTSLLAKWRCQHDPSGPPYMKLGLRIVTYDQDELDAWMRDRARRSSSRS
jgi:predicted DNA-binding transcriptional regulator AlpA